MHTDIHTPSQYTDKQHTCRPCTPHTACSKVGHFISSKWRPASSCNAGLSVSHTHSSCLSRSSLYFWSFYSNWSHGQGYWVLPQESGLPSRIQFHLISLLSICPVSFLLNNLWSHRFPQTFILVCEGQLNVGIHLSFIHFHLFFSRTGSQRQQPRRSCPQPRRQAPPGGSQSVPRPAELYNPPKQLSTGMTSRRSGVQSPLVSHPSVPVSPNQHSWLRSLWVGNIAWECFEILWRSWWMLTTVDVC